MKRTIHMPARKASTAKSAATKSQPAKRAPSTPRQVREARPAYRTEDDERAFWATANTLDHSEEDSTLKHLQYADPPRDRHQLKGVLLRLDGSIIDRLKEIAHTKGIGYQTLIRLWVMERLQREAS